MRAAITAALMLVLAVPALADEVEDSIDAALKAYRAGDVKTAKEELDFAAQLISQMRAESLRALLPAPMPGWQREDVEGDTQAMPAFGGGQMAGARYTKGEDSVEIQIMADNQMVTAMGAMFSNMALLGSMGMVKRVGDEKVVVTPDGQLQSLVDGRIMVQIGGTADDEAKLGYFEAIDLERLKGF
jgi:hypothetical protein